MILLLLAALPGLFWESGPSTAPLLRDAGITHISVPAAQTRGWKDAPGLTVETADLQSAVKLASPGVNYRIGQASASRDPWLDANGWRFLREPQGRFYYDVPGAQTALAAAEAFCYGANATIRTGRDGLKPLAQMLAFLRGLDIGEAPGAGQRGKETPAVADIGFIDDGSPAAGEVLNLLVRENLLVKLVRSPEPDVKLTVRFGSREYPLEDAKNPTLMAHVIRSNLTDDKRSVRIYGTAVVVARLTRPDGHLRVHLLNYAGPGRKVNGMRVRVLGRYPKYLLRAAGSEDGDLLDYSVDGDATEFTLRELQTYAVIDLSR